MLCYAFSSELFVIVAAVLLCSELATDRFGHSDNPDISCCTNRKHGKPYKRETRWFGVIGKCLCVYVLGFINVLMSQVNPQPGFT